MGVSNDLSIHGLHHEPETDSSRSSGEDTISAFSSPPASPSSAISSDSGQQGHYRGITFEEILPPHLITNAPSPEVDQEQERREYGAARPPASCTSASTAAKAELLRVSSTKCGYPSVKNLGSESRLRATARALVRHLSVTKRDSPK